MVEGEGSSSEEEEDEGDDAGVPEQAILTVCEFTGEAGGNLRQARAGQLRASPQQMACCRQARSRGTAQGALQSVQLLGACSLADMASVLRSKLGQQVTRASCLGSSVFCAAGLPRHTAIELLLVHGGDAAAVLAHVFP